MYTVLEYYAKNPDASLKDYIDYTVNYNKESKEKEDERYDKCIEWYKLLAGCYFIIKHNEYAFSVVKVDKWPSTEFKNIYDCYNIDIRYNGIKFEKREINRYWFGNPYEKDYYGRELTKCKKISEEEFNSIVDKYKKMKEIIESIDLKV